MANPWDSDPVVGGNPWEADPVISKPKKNQFANVQTTVTNGGRNSFRAKPAKPPGQGATPEQVNAYLDRITGTNLDPTSIDARPREQTDVSAWDLIPAVNVARRINTQEKRNNLLAGIGKAFADVPHMARQAALQADVVKTGLEAAALNRIAPNAGNEWVRKFGLPAQDRLNEQYAVNADRAQIDAPLMSTGQGISGYITGSAAQFMGPGAALRGTAGARAFLPATIGGNAIQGGVLGWMQPAENPQQQMENARTGALLGGGLAAIPRAIPALKSAPGRIIRAISGEVDPIKAEAIQVARSAQIPLHASQVSDSIPAKTVASAGKYLPFSGSTKAARAQQDAFNRALSRTFGADATRLTDEVMSNARRARSSEFEAIYNRNNVNMTPDDLRGLSKIESEASRRLTQDQAQIVKNQLDDILAEMDHSGVITGQKYQSLRTQIMKAEGGDKVGEAVKALRKEFDNIAARSVGPQDAQALARLRGQWANFRTVENLLRQVGGASGDVKPSAVWPAIRNGSTKEMRNLGRVGQVLLKDPIPDSGTAGRLMSANAYNPLAWPFMAGNAVTGATLGRAANSQWMAKLLASGRAPDAAPLLAPGRLSGVVGSKIAGNRKK